MVLPHTFLLFIVIFLLSPDESVTHIRSIDSTVPETSPMSTQSPTRKGLLMAIITPLKNSAPVNAEAIRSSAGALTTIPVCRVGSIRNTLRQLQTEGFQIVAATEKSRKLLYDADFRRPTALVMGAEDTGISKEVLKLCDEQLAIPLIGHIESLNVSAAAAVMLFEVVRQRIGE